jgi:alpha-glucosidase
VLSPTFVPFEDDQATFADADALMVGVWLLAAPVTREGAREVEVYLPRGPEGWRDFWTGQVFTPGQVATIAAPLERLPLLAPTGAIVATTDSGGDYSRLHDESSRALCLFPGLGAGQSTATLYEDDGISIEGESTRLTVALDWTPSRIRVALTASGDYPLPYHRMRVVLPEGETRGVELVGGGVVELLR